MMKMSCHPRTKSMKNGCCHLLVRYCRLNERNSVDTLPLRGKGGGRLSSLERRCRAARTSFTVSPERMDMHGRRGCMSIRVAQLTAVFSVSEQVAAGSFAILPPTRAAGFAGGIGKLSNIQPFAQRVSLPSRYRRTPREYQAFIWFLPFALAGGWAAHSSSRLLWPLGGRVILPHSPRSDEGWRRGGVMVRARREEGLRRGAGAPAGIRRDSRSGA